MYQRSSATYRDKSSKSSPVSGRGSRSPTKLRSGSRSPDKPFRGSPAALRALSRENSEVGRVKSPSGGREGQEKSMKPMHARVDKSDSMRKLAVRNSSMERIAKHGAKSPSKGKSMEGAVERSSSRSGKVLKRSSSRSNVDQSKDKLNVSGGKKHGKSVGVAFFLECACCAYQCVRNSPDTLCHDV